MSVECCEQTVFLVPKIRDIISTGQMQWQYKSGAAKWKLSRARKMR